MTDNITSVNKFSISVLASPQALPGFWIFMYRVSPFTYLVSGVLSVGLANADISCTSEEFLHFSPPSASTCFEYLAPFVESNGGYLSPSSMNSTTQCVFCTGSKTNIFLDSVSSHYDERWRNFGISIVYVVFNVAAAIGLYWLARVPKGQKEPNSKVSKSKKSESPAESSSGNGNSSVSE